MKVSKNSQLMDYVRVYKNVIKKEHSDFIIARAKKYDSWHTHQWSSYKTILPPDEKNTSEFQRSGLDVASKLILHNYINDTLDLYYHEVNMNQHRNGFSNISLNHYTAGTKMSIHYDHIHSVFDGNTRGIPILSALGLLHSDFKGGEFIICNDYHVPFEGGDIVIFPSLFLYPHEVTTVTEGDRYSFVAWAY